MWKSRERLDSTIIEGEHLKVLVLIEFVGELGCERIELDRDDLENIDHVCWHSANLIANRSDDLLRH